MAWFVLDAREHDYRLTKSQFILLFAIMAFAAPVYFVRSRGRKGWKALLRFYLFLLCLALAVGAGLLVAVPFLYFRGYDVFALIDKM